MAKEPEKKSANQVSHVAENMMKASVSQPIKPQTDKERFYRNGRDFLIQVSQDSKKFEVRIYEIFSDHETIIYRQNHKTDSQPSELITLAKQWIEGYTIGANR
jgi:hypothetical protein